MKDLLKQISEDKPLDTNNQPLDTKTSLLNQISSIDREQINLSTPQFQFTGNTGFGDSKYDSGTPFSALENLNEIRAKEQPRLAKLGAGVFNTGVQMLGDLGKGASYLLDWEQVNNLVHGTEQEFGNWFSNTMDKFEESAKIPVYRTRASIGFHPESAGWWADQMPSLGSTLSLALPAVGIVGGLSKLGKLAGGEKLLQELGWGIKEAQTLKGLAGAATSRYMENTMEGAQTFQDTYQQLLTKGIDEPKAKQIAAEAARQNWVSNTSNLIFDIPEYMLAFKPFSGAKHFYEKTLGTFAAEASLEGVEEMRQFISDKEAQRDAFIKNDIIKDDKSTYIDRLGKYSQDPDFWNSTVGGLLGGAVFGGYAKLKQNKNQKIIDKNKEQFFNDLLDKYGSVLKDNEGKYNDTDDKTFLEVLFKSTGTGTLDQFEDHLNKMKDEAFSLTDSKERTDATSLINKRLQDIKTYKDFSKKVNNELIPDELKPMKAYGLTAENLINKRLQEAESKIHEISTDDIIHGNITQELSALRNNIISNTEKNLNEIPDDQLNESIKIRVNQILQDKEVYLDINTQEDLSKALQTSSIQNLHKEITNKEYLNKQLQQVRELIKDTSTKAGQERLLKEIKKHQEDYAKEQETKAEKEKNPEPEAQETLVSEDKPTETGVVQHQHDLTQDSNIENIPYVSKEKDDKGGFTWTLEDGTRVSSKDNWSEPNVTSRFEDKEVLHSPKHFNDIYNYHVKANEDEIKSTMLATKKTREQVLQDYPNAFIAVRFKEELSKIVSEPNWEKKISFVIGKVKTNKQDTITSRGNLKLVSNPKYHVLLQIKTSEGKKSFFHPYSTEFYQLKDDKGNYKGINAEDLTLQEFKDNFRFEFQDTTTKSFEEFKENFKKAQDFNRKLSTWYEQQNTDKFLEVPEGAIVVTPVVHFNFAKTDIPLEDTQLKDNPIIFLHESTITFKQGKMDNMPSLPKGSETQFGNTGYYLAHEFPNKVKKWVKLNVKGTAVSKNQQEALSQRFNSVIKKIQDINWLEMFPEEIKQRKIELISELNTFITLKNKGFNYTFYINSHDSGKYFLQAVLTEQDRRDSQKKVEFKTELKDFDELISNLNIQTKSGSLIGLTLSDFRENPAKNIEGINVSKYFNLSTTPEIAKDWSINLDYNSDKLVIESPQEEQRSDLEQELSSIQEQGVNQNKSLEERKVDIERRRQEDKEKLRKFTEEVDKDVKSGKIRGADNKEFSGTNIDYSSIDKKYNEELAKLEYTNLEGFTEEDLEEIKRIQKEIEQGNQEDPFKFRELIENHTPSTKEALISLKNLELPPEFSISSLEAILDTLKVNGIPVGLFRDHALYLTKTASKADYFHEAFHAIFRNLISSEKAQLYLNKKKEELGYSKEQLESEKQKLIDTVPKYKDLNSKDLEDLVYEEQLANAYEKYRDTNTEKRSIWKDLFDYLKAFVNWISGRTDIDALYSKIQSGGFKNSQILRTKYNTKGKEDSVYKTIPGLTGTQSSHLVLSIASQYYKGVQIEDSYKQLLDSYDIRIPANAEYIKNSTNPEKARRTSLTIWTAMSSDVGKSLLLEQVYQKLKLNKYSEEQEENDELNANAEQRFDQFDKSNFEVDPADGPGQYVKNFISTTEFDGYDLLGRLSKVPLDWKTVYSTLLPVLNESITSQDSIFETMELLAKYRPKIKALITRLKEETGYTSETPDGTKNQNLLIRWKKGFQVVPALYIQAKIVDNKQTKEITSDVYYENKKDIASKIFDQWNNGFIDTDPDKLRIAVKDIDYLIARINKQEVTNPLNRFTLPNAIQKVFDQIGINFTYGLLDFSFGDSPESIKNKEALQQSGVNITPMSSEDLNYIKEAIRSNKPLFERSVTGQAGLMEKLSLEDMKFNDNFIVNTYQDPEGKNRYSWVTPSLVDYKSKEWKSFTKKELEEKKKQNSEYYSFNPILADKNAYEILQLTETGLAGAISTQSINEQGEQEDTKGISMRSQDTDSVIMTLHAYFGKQELKNNINTCMYWLTQIESKRTQIATRLPVKEFMKSGKLTEEGKLAVWRMFLQEYKRVQGDFGDNFTSTKYITFDFMNEVQPTDLEANKEQYLKLIEDKLVQEVKNHKKYLEEQHLDTLLNQSTIKSYGSLDNYLGNFISNNFIWNNSYLQLLNGDIAWSKSFIDYIKRTAGMIASGANFGNELSKIAYINDIDVFYDPDLSKDTYITKEEFEKQKEQFSNYLKATPNDAGVWASAGTKMKDLRKLGNLTDKQLNVIQRIIDPEIRNGKAIFVTSKEIEDSGIDFIPSKQVVRGTDTQGNEVYIKCSINYLSKQFTSKYKNGSWIPLRGKEYLHQMREYLETHDLDFVVPKSASKLFFPKEKQVSNLDGTPTSFEFSDNYRRLQVENNTKSTDLVPYSNQLDNVISSEVTSDKGFKLRDQNNELLAKQKNQVFDFYKNLVIKTLENSKVQRNLFSVILDKFKSIIEDTSPDSQLGTLIDNGDTNLLHIQPKLEQLYLSMFKDAFRLKSSGRILTSITSQGINILQHLDGSIITDEEQQLNPDSYDNENYITRPLKSSEILLPRKWSTLANLKVGDTLTNEIFNGLGFRIPLQSYSFIAPNLTVAGFMPDYYGDSGILSSIHNLRMGMDQDIDKIFFMMKGWYQNKAGELVIHGTETDNEAKFEGFVHDQLKNNSFFYQEFNKNLKNNHNWRILTRDNTLPEDISEANETLVAKLFFNPLAEKEERTKIYNQVISQTLEELGLPNTATKLSTSGIKAQSVLANQSLDKIQEMLKLPELQNSLNSYYSDEGTDTAVKLALEGKEAKKTTGLANSISSFVQANKDNSMSVSARGIVVNGGTVNQFLSSNNIELKPENTISIDGITYKKFRTEDLRAKADKISTVVGSIIDIVKKPVSDILNWTQNTLPTLQAGLSLGIPDNTLTNLLIQDSLRDIVNYEIKAKRAILPLGKIGQGITQTNAKYTRLLQELVPEINKSSLSKEEKDALIKNINSKDYGTLDSTNLDKYKKGLSKDIKEQVQYYFTQLNAISTFSKLKDIADSGRRLSTILSLNRGTSTNFAENEKYSQVYEALIGDKSTFEGIQSVLDSNPVIQANLKNVQQMQDSARVMFLSRTTTVKNIISRVQKFTNLNSSQKGIQKTKELQRNLLSALQTQLFFNQLQVEPGSFIRLLVGNNTIADHLLEARKLDIYKDNKLLHQILKAEFPDNKVYFSRVTADSRTKFTQANHDRFLDDFKDIVISEKDLGKTKFEKLSTQLVMALAIKDNFQFTNGSYIKFIDSVMFRELSKKLEALNNLLANDNFDEKEFLDITGISLNQFTDNFVENYVRHAYNKENVKYVKETSTITNNKGKKVEHKVLSKKTNIDGSFIYTLNQENSEAIEAYKSLEIKGEPSNYKVQFPEYLTQKNKETGYSTLYKRADIRDTQALYIISQSFNIRGLLPYAFTPTQNEKLAKEIKKGNELRTKKAKEDITKEIKDGTQPLEDPQFTRTEGTPEEEQILISLLEDFKERLGVSYNLITEAQAKEISSKYNGEPAFYFKGETYYVKGKFNSSDTIHESSHFLVDSLVLDNHDLFVKLLSDLIKTPEGDKIYTTVENLYPEDFNNRIPSTKAYKEILVQGLEQLAHEKQLSTPYKNALQKLLEAITRMIRRIFRKPITLKDLSFNTTLKELADLIVSDRKFDINPVKSSEIQPKRINEEEPEIPKALLESIKKVVTNLQARQAELKGLTGGPVAVEVQQRRNIIYRTLQRLEQEASYELVISAANSELKYAYRILQRSEVTFFSFNEAKRIVDSFKDFRTLLGEIPEEFQEKVNSIMKERDKLFTKLAPIAEQLIQETFKQTQVPLESRDKLHEDVQGFTANVISASESTHPNTQAISKLVQIVKRDTNSEEVKLDNEIKEMRGFIKEYPNVPRFDSKGNLTNPYTTEYFEDIARMFNELDTIKEEEKRNTIYNWNRVNAKNNEIFQWYKDNHDYYLNEKGIEKYKERSKQEEEVAKDSDDPEAHFTAEEWKYKYSPYHILEKDKEGNPLITDGKVSLLDRIPRAKIEYQDSTKNINNSHWHKFLRAKVKSGSKYHNSDFQKIKDDKAYNFFTNRILAALAMNPHEVSLDVGNYEKFLNNFSLQLTENKGFKESVQGLSSDLMDWFSTTVSKRDIDGGIYVQQSDGTQKFIPNERLFDEKGRPKVNIQAGDLESIKKFSKDPFQVLQNYYKQSLMYQHYTLIDPMVQLLLGDLEESPAIRKSFIGKVFKDLDENPRVVQQGLENEYKRARYFYRANVTGKSKTDANEGVLSTTADEEKFLNDNPDKTIRKVSGVQISDTLATGTRLIGLGLKIPAAFANLIYGFSSSSIHSARETDFNDNEFFKAGSIITFAVGRFVSFNKISLGNSEKLAKLAEKFGLTKNLYESQDVDPIKKTRNRIEKFMYSLMEGGEYLISTQLMVAKMLHTEVKNLKGEKKNLWEAYDTNGEWKVKEFGEQPEWEKQIVLNDKKENTSKIFEFQNRLDFIRKSTQGDYQDPLMVKQKWWGRQAMIYRTWIPQAIQQRFGTENPDINFKGRYLSGASQLKAAGKYKLTGIKPLDWTLGVAGEGILGVSITSLKGLNLYIPFTKKYLLETLGIIQPVKKAYENHLEKLGLKSLDIENIRANMRELQLIMYSYILYSIFKGLSGNDDPKDKFLANMALRNYQDLTFFLIPASTLNVIKNPIPVWKTISDASDAAYAMQNYFEDQIFDTDEDTYTKGRNAGKSKAWKEFSDILPPFTAIHSTQNAISQIYGQGMYKGFK